MSTCVMEENTFTQMQSSTQIEIGANRKLTLRDANSMRVNQCLITTSAESLKPMESSYNFLSTCVENQMPVYGINTNFGDQVNFIDELTKTTHDTGSYEAICRRQANIIKSLSCSVGSQVPAECIKVTMLLRAHCLAQGYSGISADLITALLAFLNAGIVPIVGCYGSIGASGDLIPLSTIASALIGEDVEVLYQKQIMLAPKALQLAGLSPFKPVLRDGLALINGTSFMTAIASLAAYDLQHLFYQMLSAVAMSLESMLVISSAYHPLIHQLKRHSGENSVNDFFLRFWQGSRLLSQLDDIRSANITSRDENAYIKPVQDFYSLRAVPQGFGPFYENLKRTTVWIEEEMNSVNDNPIIDVVEQEIYHGANFMGYYITDACDILKLNIAQASTWIHALLANMVHPRKSHQLPTNLVENPGKNNGFRSLQLLAAALSVQNRKFAQGHQAYTLPTEGDNQDVNSLGTHAALDLREAVANLERLTAILLLASTQALELRGIDNASDNAQEIYLAIREVSPTVTTCRPMAGEIEAVIGLLKNNKIPINTSESRP